MWLWLSRVIGSAGSKPTVASSISSRSLTVRASGPPMSWLWASGTIPSRLDKPIVPRSPHRLFADEGFLIDPHVSVPIPAAAKLAATAAAVPPLEPPGLRVGS